MNKLGQLSEYDNLNGITIKDMVFSYAEMIKSGKEIDSDLEFEENDDGGVVFKTYEYSNRNKLILYGLLFVTNDKYAYACTDKDIELDHTDFIDGVDYVYDSMGVIPIDKSDECKLFRYYVKKYKLSDNIAIINLYKTIGLIFEGNNWLSDYRKLKNATIFDILHSYKKLKENNQVMITNLNYEEIGNTINVNIKEKHITEKIGLYLALFFDIPHNSRMCIRGKIHNFKLSDKNLLEYLQYCIIYKIAYDEKIMDVLYMISDFEITL